MDQKELNELELAILNSGKWGTIAPYSISAASALADFTGAKRALLCHSADAAYEAVLRHLGARFSDLPHGDGVIVGACSAPQNALVALCVGSEPIFAPVCESCGMVSPRALEALLEESGTPVRAVVIDYLAEREGAENYPLDRVKAICRDHGVPLVINAGGCVGARHKGQPLTAYADAVFYSLGKGSAVDAGGGGFVTTDNDALWAGAFAYHNCGRAFGVGCSLVMDNILGGDMRVTEWVSAVAEEILRSGALAIPTPRTMADMKDQPVFRSEYAKKLMGKMS